MKTKILIGLGLGIALTVGGAHGVAVAQTSKPLTEAEQVKKDLPYLLRWLEANATQGGHHAFRALLKIAPDDPQVMAALERALLTPRIDSHYAKSLCETAAEAGTAARGLKNAFKKMLTFHGDWLAHEAFITLGKVEGGAANTSVPAALEILNQWPQTTPEKMSVAMLALQEAGAEGKPALPRLVQLWETQQPPYLRHAVIRTIGKIGPGSNAEATQLLFDALWANPNTGQAGEAVLALGNFREGDKEALPVLVAALSTRLTGHPTIVAKALGKIGPAAQPAAAQLIKLAEAKDILNYANLEPLAVGLMGIGTQAKGASQLALKVLDRWETVPNKWMPHNLRGLMLALIAKTDTPTDAESRKRVLAHIVSVFRTAQEWNQSDILGATMAAGAIGLEAAAIVPDLLRIVEGELGWADQGHSLDLHPTYMDMMTDAKGEIWGEDLLFPRVEAIRALAKMGAAAEPAVPALTKMANLTNPQQPNYGLRKEAAQALRVLGKAEQGKVELANNKAN